MPRRPSSGERWRILGRLLPADVRERIFEPAFSDLLYDSLTATPEQAPRAPFALRAVGTYMGCMPVALPRLFVRRGRLTRLGRVALAVTGVLLLVAILLARMYGEYDPSGY